MVYDNPHPTNFEGYMCHGLTGDHSNSFSIDIISMNFSMLVTFFLNNKWSNKNINGAPPLSNKFSPMPRKNNIASSQTPSDLTSSSWWLNDHNSQ
jgi:hypothetical protein